MDKWWKEKRVWLYRNFYWAKIEFFCDFYPLFSFDNRYCNRFRIDLIIPSIGKRQRNCRPKLTSRIYFIFSIQRWQLLTGFDALRVKYFLTVRSFGCNWTKKLYLAGVTRQMTSIFGFLLNTHTHTLALKLVQSQRELICVCEFVDTSAYEGCPSINGGFYLYEKIQGV